MDGFIIIGSKSHLADAFVTIHKSKNYLLSIKECDIRDQKSVDEAISCSNYEYVLNCAAITNLEWCEEHKEECFKTNVNGTKNVEIACKKYNKKLIQISSDYAINPINVYGESKSIMEKVLDKDTSLILRSSFYYKDYKPFRSLLDKTITVGFSNLYFNPVSSYFLAEQIIKNRGKTGIINIFSDKKISKSNFLKMFCNTYGIDDRFIRSEIYNQDRTGVKRINNSYVKPDISTNLREDLILFKKYSGL